MSNTNIEAYNSSTDVGEKIAAVPSEIGSEGFQQKQSENLNINRPNRQDRLSFDQTHDSLSRECQIGSNTSDNTKKTSTQYVPKRTSSAPPEEHVHEIPKNPAFQPTKTSHGMISSPVDSIRKQSGVSSANRSKTNSFSEPEAGHTPNQKNHSALSPAVIRSPAVAALFERNEGDYVPRLSLDTKAATSGGSTPRTDAVDAETTGGAGGYSGGKPSNSGVSGGIASRDSPSSRTGDGAGSFNSEYSGSRERYAGREGGFSGNYRDNNRHTYNNREGGSGGRGNGSFVRGNGGPDGPSYGGGRGRGHQSLNPNSRPFTVGEGGYRPPPNSSYNGPPPMQSGGGHFNPQFQQPHMQIPQYQVQYQQGPGMMVAAPQITHMHIPMGVPIPQYDPRFPNANNSQSQFQPPFPYVNAPTHMPFPSQQQQPGGRYNQPQQAVAFTPQQQIVHAPPSHPSFGVGVTSEQLKAMGAVSPQQVVPIPQVGAENGHLASPQPAALDGKVAAVSQSPSSPGRGVAQMRSSPHTGPQQMPHQQPQYQLQQQQFGQYQQPYVHPQSMYMQQSMYPHAYAQQQFPHQQFPQLIHQQFTTMPPGSFVRLPHGGGVPQYQQQGGYYHAPTMGGVHPQHQAPHLGVPLYPPHTAATPAVDRNAMSGVPMQNPSLPTQIPATAAGVSSVASTTVSATTSVTTNATTASAGHVSVPAVSTETATIASEVPATASAAADSALPSTSVSTAAATTPATAVIELDASAPQPATAASILAPLHGDGIDPQQQHQVPVQMQYAPSPPMYMQSPAQVCDVPPTRPPRKALVFTKKDGTPLDLNSFKASSVVSAAPAVVVAVTTTESLPATVDSTTGDNATADVAAPVVPSPASEVIEPLEALRISTPEVETRKEPSPTPSPLVKNVNIPVTIGLSSSKKAASASPVTEVVGSTEGVDVVAHDAPVTVQAPSSSTIPVTLTGTAASSNFSKTKRSKKDILAAADAASASASSDMLSAYTDNQSPSMAPVVAASVAAETTTSSTPQASTPTSLEDSLPDSWDDDLAGAAIVPSAVVEPAPKGRSLRPGGVKSGGGPPIASRHHVFHPKVYTKAEMLALRPEEKFPNPFGSSYNIQSGSESAGGYRGGPSQGGGGWPKHHGRGGGSAPGSAHHSSNNSYDANMGGQEGGGGSGWKRDSLPAHQQQSGRSGHRRQQSNVPMPKKQIVDPVERLTTEVMAILNKITPQTFEKLSAAMLGVNVTNTSMLDTLIELIFEKAVQEPNFTVVYADLCAYLTTNATTWNFYMVVRDVDTADFFWIKDFAFEPVAAGPYYSQKECMLALYVGADEGEEEPPLPEMRPIVASMDTVDVLLSRNLLMKVHFNTSSKEYFVTYLPFGEIAEEMRSQSTFSDEEAARKDAKKKNNFRSRLVNSCQNEFQNGVKNESTYAQLERTKAALHVNRANMSDNDFYTQEAAIDEQLMKLKRRMLGNIRFVGELYKQALLQTGTMHSCIEELLGSPQSGWKDMRDEQDIELLCRLITTVGETLEGKSQSSKDRNHAVMFESYFQRLAELARDKSLNSRMRFAIEEVISLRANRWQARRQQEGPLKIAEIHQRVMEEEARIALQQAQLAQGQPHGYRGSGPGRGGSAQAYQQQQQQMYALQQPQQQRTIMTRNSSGRGGGASPASGRGGRGGTPRSTPDDKDQHVKFARTTSVGPGSGDARQLSHEFAQAGGGNLRRLNSDPNHFAGRGSPAASSGAGSGSFASPSSATASPSVALTFTDSVAIKQMKGALTEYLGNNDDIAELRLRLSEASTKLYYVYFVLEVLGRIVDAKPAVLQSLLTVLRDEELTAVLRTLSVEVEAALATFEPLMLLVDTVMDSKEAPERLGMAVSSLVESGVLSVQRVSSLTEDHKAQCADDGSYEADDIATVYGRFLSTLLQAKK